MFDVFIFVFNIILHKDLWFFEQFLSSSEFLFVLFFTPAFLFTIGSMGFFDFFAVTFFIVLQLLLITFLPFLFTKNIRATMRGFVALGWILMWFSMVLSTHQSNVLLWNGYDQEYQNADAAGFPLEVFHYPVCYPCGHDIPALSEYWIWVPFFLNCVIWISACVFVGYYIKEKYDNIKHVLFVVALSFALSFLCFGHLLSMYD